MLIKPGDKLVIPAGSTPQLPSTQVYGPPMIENAKKYVYQEGVKNIQSSSVSMDGKIEAQNQLDGALGELSNMDPEKAYKTLQDIRNIGKVKEVGVVDVLEGVLDLLNPFSATEANAAAPAIPLAGAAIRVCVSNPTCFNALQVATTALFANAFYKADFFEKAKHGASKQQIFNKPVDTQGTPPSGDWEPDKKFEKHNDFDRKTCKYKDSEAHTNGFKNKSPAPKDGQKNLPNSYRFSESGRVAVDIENNEIIIFRRTGANEYHGYVIKPETLISEEHNAAALLRNLGKIGKKGNILK